MEQPQADWLRGAVVVEREGADARREFIRRTYVHFLVGLLAFCCITWGIMSSGAAMQVATSIGFWPSLIGLVILGFAYRWFFASANMTTHYVGFGLTIAFYAVLTAPLFYFAQLYQPGVLRDAFMLTALGFGGLTGYALISKKDFSFLGGALSMLTFLGIGVAVLGVLFGGLGMHTVLSFFFLLVFGGWVLYDTSMIMRYLPLNGYVFGATMLFIDFVVMLRQVVFLLLASRD